MMQTALLIAAFVCFVIAVIVPDGRVGWAGLACWTLSLLIGRM